MEVKIDPLLVPPLPAPVENPEIERIDTIESVPLEAELPHSFYIEPDTSSGHQFSSSFAPLEIDPPESLQNKPSRGFHEYILQFVNAVSAIEVEHMAIAKLARATQNDIFTHNLKVHLEHLQEIEKESKNKDWWDFLKRFAANLLSAATVIIGASLLAPAASIGAIIGGSALILSGGLSLVATTFFEAGKYKDIGLWMMIASSAIGVCGGGLGFYSGFSFKEIIGKIITVTLSVLSNSAQIAKEVKNYELEELKAETALVRETMEGATAFSKLLQLDYETFSQDLTAATEEIVLAAKRHEIACRRITMLSGPGAAA